jgi:hypothetical protein
VNEEVLLKARLPIHGYACTLHVYLSGTVTEIDFHLDDRFSVSVQV